MKKHFSVLTVFILMMALSTAGFATVQVGEPVFEKFDTPHPYVGGAGLVMEKVYHYPNAGYISLHFQGFDLAPGDYVEIMSGDESISYTYSGKGKLVNNGKESISEFWATHIPGDTTVVRLYSHNPNGAFGFVIDQWVRGYEKQRIAELVEGLEAAMDLPRPEDPEAICSSDDMDWAKCHEGTEMYNKARTVARLLMNGSSACTGWLLGSEGHLMTNQHCIGSQSTANNTDYEFMAEGANCTTNCSSWFACPGTVEATSGTLVKVNSSLDYALVLLPTNLTGTYGYLQFKDTLPSVGDRIYIP
ncbi:MAG: trypsin-like peptidase domain-containing protein, partial [bacterium]|nr:trypsin-like peptidase domain-containing protein [bacterium]